MSLATIFSGGGGEMSGFEPYREDFSNLSESRQAVQLDRGLHSEVFMTGDVIQELIEEGIADEMDEYRPFREESLYGRVKDRLQDLLGLWCWKRDDPDVGDEYRALEGLLRELSCFELSPEELGDLDGGSSGPPRYPAGCVGCWKLGGLVRGGALKGNMLSHQLFAGLLLLVERSGGQVIIKPEVLDSVRDCQLEVHIGGPGAEEGKMLLLLKKR